MKKLARRQEYDVQDTQPQQRVIHIQRPHRLSLAVSRAALYFMIISVLVFFAYAGPDIGFLFAGFALMCVGGLIFELLIRLNQSRLVSMLSALLVFTLIMASNLDDNLVMNSIRIGESLQRISTIAIPIVISGIIFFTLFGRKQK